MEKYADMSIDEFISRFNNEDYEIFTESQVQRFCKDILKSVDFEEKESGAIDFVSLNRVVVVNEDLSKSILYWRPAQIEWKEEIDPVTLEKSKTGYYKDTPENRKKGIVGKRYGDVKRIDSTTVSLSKLRVEYSQALKRGDKAKASEIVKRIQSIAKKEGSGSKKTVE